MLAQRMKPRALCRALYKLGRKMHEATLGGRRFYHKDKLIDIKSEAEKHRLKKVFPKVLKVAPAYSAKTAWLRMFGRL